MGRLFGKWEGLGRRRQKREREQWRVTMIICVIWDRRMSQGKPGGWWRWYLGLRGRRISESVTL